MSRSSSLTRFTLSYPPPFDWSFLMRFLGGRATPGVEWVEGERYLRTIEVDQTTGVLVVENEPRRNRLVVELQGEVGAHQRVIAERLTTLFDLEAPLQEIHSVLAVDPALAPSLVRAPGLRVPGGWSAFEVLTRAIVGQQVSVKAATTIMGRIAQRLGVQVESPFQDKLPLLFPTPQAVADSELLEIGMPARRVHTIRTIARAIADRTLPLRDDVSNVAALDLKAALLALPGIGPWTVEYFALRFLRDRDAWPGSDLILNRQVIAMAGESRADQVDRVEAWRPWRAYAALYLWNRANQPTPS